MGAATKRKRCRATAVQRKKPPSLSVPTAVLQIALADPVQAARGSAQAAAAPLIHCNKVRRFRSVSTWT